MIQRSSRDDASIITRNSHSSQMSKTSQAFQQRDQMVRKKELEQKLIEKYKLKYAKGNKINNYYIEKIVHNLVNQGKLNEADLQNAETKIALYSKMERPFLIDYDFNSTELGGQKKAQTNSQWYKTSVTPTNAQRVVQLVQQQNMHNGTAGKAFEFDNKSQHKSLISDNKQQKHGSNWVPVLDGQKSDAMSIRSKRSHKSYSILGRQTQTQRPQTQNQQQQQQSNNLIPKIATINNNFLLRQSQPDQSSQQMQQQQQSQSNLKQALPPPELSITKKIIKNPNQAQLTKQYIRSLDPRQLYYNEIDMEKEIEMLSEDSRPPKSVIYIDKEGADEWATLVKFDSEMYKAEQERALQIKKEQKKKFAEELAKQLEEKNRRKNIDKYEVQAFVKVRDEQINAEKVREVKSQEEHKKLIIDNNQDLKQQIHMNRKINRIHSKHEQKQEENMVQQFIEEQKNEQQRLQERQIKTKNFLLSVMKESEEQQKLKKMMEDQEKFYDQQQAQNYFQKMDELDRIKESEKQQRLEKLKQQMNKWDKFKQIFQDNTNKLQQEDEKIDNYLKQQDEKAKNQDQQIIIKKQTMKKEIVKELEKQIQEKKAKQDHEDQLNQLQADIWKQDTKEYIQQQQQFKNTVKGIVMENQQQVKQQIEEKELFKKMGKMSIEELLQNKRQLSQIKEKSPEQLKETNINDLQKKKISR